MTTAHVAPIQQRSALEGLGDELAALSAEFDCDSLVESRSGTVLSHALQRSERGPVLSAVVRRSTRPLHEAAKTRRTVAVLPAGPVQRLRIEPDEALVLPLHVGGELLGWWWLIGAPPSDQDIRLASGMRLLEHMLQHLEMEPIDHMGLRLLAGQGPLPGQLAGEPLHVASLRVDDHGVVGIGPALRNCVRGNPVDGVTSLVVSTVEGADVILSGASELMVLALNGWIACLRPALATSVSAAVAGPRIGIEELPLLREQALWVLRTAGRPGTCVPLGLARQVLVQRHLEQAVGTLPALGPDPLAPLFDDRAQKAMDLAGSLLAWLDAHGQTLVAADQLGVHPNTLRYRIARARDLLSADLDDPEVRLEVHLRLRRSFRDRQR